MGTASTMACIVEIMGLALPHSASIPATHADRLRSAEASGRQAAAMAESGGPKPSELMTAAAFRNALVVLQAIGGSTNGLIHLTAAAGRLGIAIDLDEVDRARPRGAGAGRPQAVGARTTWSTSTGPAACRAWSHELADLLDLDARDVCGTSLARAARAARHARRAGRHPAALESDQRERQHGRAARQPRAARRDHQAVGGDARASCSTPAAPSSSIRSRT